MIRIRFVYRDSALSTILVMLEAGSLCDPIGQEGLSHYLEHVIFDASKEFPTQRHVTRAFASIGAQTNGYTTFNSAGYYGTCRSRRVREMVDVLSSLLCRPLVTEEDVTRERQVILSELKDGKDQPWSVFWLAAMQDAVGWKPGIGTEETVQATTHDMVAAHYRDLYGGLNNVVITLCGSVDETQYIRQAFAGIEEQGRPGRIADPTMNLEPFRMVEPRFRQACMAMMFPNTPGYGAIFRDNLIAAMASNCIAGADFSLLMRRLRGELGITYWVSGDVVRWDASGFAWIASQFDPHLLDTVLNETNEVIAAVAENGISDDTVDFAKNAMLTSAAYTFETTGGRTRQFGEYRLFGTEGIPDDYEGYEALITNIGVEEIKSYVRRVYGAAPKSIIMVPS